jgi:hypothetical protein
MPAATLSTAAWAVHDVGLATAIGGTLFGRTALQPALHEISSPMERDRVSADAWQRFSLFNLIAHGTMAATWFIGRTMLSGREVTLRTRQLTRIKDGLVIASLVTGVGSILLGNRLGKLSREGMGPAEIHDRVNQDEVKRTKLVQRATGGLGILNLVTNVGIMALTTVLAMQGNKSSRFALWSRRLP